MSICLVTGSGGMVGSESVRFFAAKGFETIGIDNDMRSAFFGESASTLWNLKSLQQQVTNYTHYEEDIRNFKALEQIYKRYGQEISLIIHTAAQPSHDWAAKEPFMDFTINANSTLNILELTRRYCADAVFIFTSTNKVYGDTPNSLPLKEHETRYEIAPDHPYSTHGIDEHMSVDRSKHSLFGVSKLAADILAQEYGYYFGMKTAVFRCGCITGGHHSGTQLHGFLSYLMQCVMNDIKYTIIGYKGKQVRDIIHSYDLVSMFWHFYNNPKQASVYNAGGGRFSNCSVIEAIEMAQQIAGEKLKFDYNPKPRKGDHKWWISDISKFRKHYPQWDYTYDVEQILLELFNAIKNRE